MCQVLGVRRQVPDVRFNVLRVTCHLSYANANSHSNAPNPSFSPPLCTVEWNSQGHLVRQNQL